MDDDVLTPAHLARLQELFEAALEHPTAERRAFLDAALPDDSALRDEVLALLAAHGAADARLRHPLNASLLSGAVSAADPWIGQRVGSYEIVGLIGVGGMGAVYEARRADEQYDKRVAIKFLQRQADSPAVVRRFRAERQILASLDHPGIAALIDGGVTDDGQPYFVMEYVRGQPLTVWCDEHHVSIRDRLRLFQQVAAAVQSAHQALVVHRDLKPGNILVTDDGRVKLLDFGIARLLPSDDDAGRLPSTLTAVRSFTPDYAAPEQVRGEPTGTSADVYALGVLLFELLTGRRPFELRDQRLSEMERIIQETPAPPPSTRIGAERPEQVGERSVSRVRAQVAGDLDAIVLMALRKEPSRRYGSAELMSRDVQAHLDGHPVSGRPDGWGYRTRKLIGRRKLETAAVTVASLSLIAGLVGVSIQARRARAQERRATQVTAFLSTMLGSADPASLGKDVTVRAVLDSAARRADTLAASPELEAQIRDIIGNTYMALGEFSSANAQYRRALDAHARRTGAGDEQTAVAFTRQSRALEYLGEFAAADSVLRTATALFDRHPQTDPLARARLLDQRGQILNRLGKEDEAEPLFRQALDLELRYAPGNDSVLATSYANLGFVMSEQGKDAQAESLYVAAVASARRVFGNQHARVAELLSPYATVLERAGKFAMADSVFRETIEMRRALLGAEHPEYAWTMFSYADFLMARERFAESARWCREVLKLRGKSLPDTHPAVGTAMSVLGRSLDGLDSLAEGEHWLRESLRVRKQALPAGHWLLYSSQSILGAHMVRARRFAEAEPMLLGAEQKLVEARGEKAPVVHDARTRIVALYVATGDTTKASAWRRRMQQ